LIEDVVPEMPLTTVQENQAPGGAMLHLVCPAQKRLLPVWAGFAWLLLVWRSVSLHEASDRQPWLTSFLVIGFGLFALVSLYRSFVFHETLCIYKGSDIPKRGKRVVATDKVRSVRVLPVPGSATQEAKWGALGFARGLIDIGTDTGSLRFGVGLDIVQSAAAAERIARFCGLQLEAAHADVANCTPEQ